MKRIFYIIIFLLINLQLFAQPANDDCSNAMAISISSGGFDLGVFTSTTVDITDATKQIGEVFHNVQVSAGNDKKTVWYSFTLPTARAVRIELLQPTENIAQNGVGFTVYKADNCFPGLSEISDAKLTPLNKFGSSYNPCLLPGDYLIQVSAKLESDGDIFIDLTTSMPDVLNDFFTQANAHDFGTISNGWHRQEFDAGCQVIEDVNETCSELGVDHLEYTQTAWFTFTTDADVDFISLRIGEKSGFFTGNLKVGYNIYEGDVTSSPYSGLTVFDGCQIFEQTVSNIIPVRNYLCEFAPNTTYSIQVFFHNEYTNTVFLELLERGIGATVSPDPSNIQAASELGVLASSVSGTWTYGYDQLSCNAFISDNICGTVNPASGSNGIYTMSTFYTFSLSDYMNVTFVTNGYLGKKLYFGDVQTDCNLVPIQEFTSGNTTYNCLEPGVYTMQILGKIDTSQSYINSGYNHIGAAANLSLKVVNNSISSDFLLDATGKIDTVNKISGIWEPLPDDVTINASSGRFNCSNTVLPDGSVCSANTNKAMYREIIIGDADGDGFDDEGVLTVGSGNWNLSYSFYKGSSTDLATAQNKFNWGETFTGLTPYLSCTGLSPIKVCVEPGKYTLVSFGDDTDVGRTDNPTFKFNIRETQFFDPLAPNDMGDITTALNSGSVSGTADYFSCNNNPLTIASNSPCSGATKQIYRQFYIGESMILNFSMTGGNSFRLFYGKISDGVNTLVSNIPGVGDIGCRSSYQTNSCNPLPAGWYTIVTYGIGGNYAGSVYSGGVIGNLTNISIQRIAPLNDTNYDLPHIAYDAGITDWGPNAGTTAFPENSQTYTFGTEIFNCIDNLPLLVDDCTGNNRQVFYTFEITQESYLSFSGIPSSMKAQIFEGDVSADSASFANNTQTELQECINISSINHYDRSWWLWTGRIDLCKVQPGKYTLIVLANDAHIGQSVTPVLYVDNVAESRFDFAETAYDFDLIEDNNTFQFGKVGDVNPLDVGRAASNDFFSCTTGANVSDPGQSDAIEYCWDGMYPMSGATSVDYPMADNFAQYESSTISPIRRNLWYTFVVDGPGLVTVKVENKTPSKTLQNPFAIYRSDVDGNIDFATVISGGDLDSTIAQGLTFIDNNSTFSWWGCAGNQASVDFNIDPCDNPSKQRFYIVVDQHVGLIPNSQIEVSIKHNAIVSLASNYDHYTQANVINGLNEITAPYTDVELTAGTYYGDTSSFACATKAITDQNNCGTRTLWYKFSSSISGKLRIMYDIVGSGAYYNSNEMLLFKEIVAGDSTVTGLELVSPSSVNISGQNWGETCLNIGNYYIMLSGCSYTVENVRPQIWLVEEEGDNCEQAVSIVMPSLGIESGTVSINCHDIGNSFGEDGSNMACLFGPDGYKSTWFRIDLNFIERADVTFQLSENTTALPSQIRYRVLYGTCNSMTAGPCNTDALTEFTLNCMMSESSSYFVQVVTPESATGDITLTVTATESPNQSCEPFDPLTPTANFTFENTCEGDTTCFSNQSTLGDSITYAWTFDYGGVNATSSEINPCYEFATSGTFDVELIVTNMETGSADTIMVPVTIYPRPDPNITRNPSTYEVISGELIDFASNVTNTIVTPPTSYQWDMNNGDTPTDADPQDIVYGNSNLGLNIIYVTVTNGTCSVIDTNELMVGFEPIFNGGFYDGSAVNLQECTPEIIFAGGFYDGSSSDVQVCVPYNIFAGGYYDGSSSDIQICIPHTVFGGGFYDGSSVNLQECTPEVIFAGGFYDGAASIILTGDIDYTVADYNICSGSSVEIAITEITTIDTVYWYNGTTLISTITTAPFDLSETLTASTTINAVVVFSGGACSSSENFSIEVVEPVVADAGVDKAICIGETIQIGTPAVSSIANYEWSNAASLDDAFIAEPNANPILTTEYCVSATDAAAVCPVSSDCMILTVNTDIPVITVDDAEICNGANINITVTGTLGGDVIDWYTSGTPNLGTATSLNVNAIGTYFVEVIRGSCSVIDSSIVSLLIPPADLLAWRTKNSGNWNVATTWQVYNGSTWVDATTYTDVCGNGITYPNYQDSTILIVNSHTVQFNIAVESVDELTIENGATVVVNVGMNLQMVDSSLSAIIPDFLNNGTITIDNTGSLTGVGDAILQNNSRINIAGDFVVDATPSPKLINSNSSTVAYTNATQYVWNGSYGRLEIAGSGLKSLTGTSTYINTEVEFIDGHILHGLRNITLAQAAVVTNASFANGFFVTNANGAVIKEGLGAVGYESFVFPIGHNSSSFNKANITNSGTSDNIRCRVEGSFNFEASFPNDELMEITSVDRTWYLTEDVIGGSDISMELFWVSAHENASFQRNDCQVGSYNTTDGWNRIGTSVAATGTDTWTDMFTHSATGITELNAFSIGSCNVPVSEYRTIVDGDWTDVSIWEVLDGMGVWVSAVTYPSPCGALTYPTSLSDAITVRHNIVYDFSIPEGIDETTIESQALLTVPDGVNLHVANGLGNDIDNSGKIYITGTATSETGFEVLSQAASLFVYNGGNQDLLDCSYAKLWIDGDLPDAVRLKTVTGNNTSVSETLDFINGKIDLANDFTMAVNATIDNASQTTGYFLATSNGYLIWGFPIGNNISRSFPLGGVYYSPADLTFAEITTAGTIFSRVRETVHPEHTNSILRYWTFNKGTIEFNGTYNMSLNYNDNDLPSIPTTPSDELAMVSVSGAYNILYPTADHWIYYPQGNGYYVDVASNLASITHNQFSDFTLMTADNPLPVSLLYLAAKWNVNDAILSWATASEANNYGFEVQRCTGDCQEFENIGFVYGNGNTNQLNIYEFVDENIKLSQAENYYYRLKQIDYDNTENYSYVVNLSNLSSVIDDNKKNLISLYPNPVNKNEEIYVVLDSDVDQEIRISVSSIIGNEIISDRILINEGTNVYTLKTNNLSEGAYVLSIIFADGLENIKFIIIE